MNYPEYLRKIIYLTELLEQGKAGTANNLAVKLNVSERTIYRYMDELRMYGAEIFYSQSQKTYFLKNDFDFKKIFFRLL